MCFSKNSHYYKPQGQWLIWAWLSDVSWTNPFGNKRGLELQKNKKKQKKLSWQSIFSLPFPPPLHAHAAFTGRLTGAEKGLFWHLVCVLKEISVREQAPSKALLRDGGWNEVLLVKQLWNPPCPHLLHYLVTASSSETGSRISPTLKGSKQAHERCPSLRCKLTHAHQPLRAEAHALQSHALISAPAAGGRPSSGCTERKKQKICVFYFAIWAVI